MTATAIATYNCDAEPGDVRTDYLLCELERRSVRGGALTLVAQAARFTLQVGSTAVLARMLTPNDFGLVAMVTAITGFVALFRDCGLPMATIQRAQITHAQVSSLFWINCGLGVMLMLAVLALSPVIAWFYHEPRLLWVTAVLSVTFAVTGLAVQHQALLRRQMRFKALSMIDVLSMAFGVSIGISMAAAGFGYWSLVGVTLGSSLLNSVLIWYKCNWRPGPFRRRVGARSMLAFGGHLTGFDLLNYFTRNFDNILIGRVLGSVAVGVYSKAYGLLMLPVNQINAPLSTVMLPALSRVQDKPADYARLYLRALKGLSLVTVPLVVFSFVLARDIILVLLGRQWLSAVAVFQLLAPAALVSAINIAPGWLCISLGHPRKQIHYGLVSAPVCVLAFIIGIRWGVEGVAAGFSLTFFIVFWLFVWYASKDSPLKFSQIFGRFLSAVLLSTGAGLVVWLLRYNALPNATPLLAIIICSVIFAFAYVASALAFKGNRDLISALFRAIRAPNTPA
jgi:O-antigen/teichoic acid export membrane protein